MHPLLNMLMTRPELLSEHAQAYAELAVCEIGEIASAGRSRLLWSAAALCCATIAAVLAGVALMLMLTLPEAHGTALLALLLTPCLPLLGALACVLNLRKHQRAPAFAELREQLSNDLRMLREVTAP
jgi:uncharacterized membrane protein YqjE